MNELPLNQVLCGDCIQIMSDFPADSVDLVVTSPPFEGVKKQEQHRDILKK
ncbi:hypothetical protein ES702_02492 [subsurface metagenome]